ncbi:hypothetical protein OAM69_00480 [bacterium]|nr:hypothetical protein [bacterium]
MSFSEEFVRSISYRSHFDSAFKIDEDSARVLERTFEDTSARALEEPFFGIRQTVCALAQVYAADNETAPYPYQCLADSHTFLNACLAQKIVNEKYMTLTVGDVSFDGQKLFDVSRSTLESAVAQGISTQDKPRFHVWLTLADMTIVDLTIINQLASLLHICAPSSDNELLNVWRTERKGRFDYHPMLVDDDFLSRLQRAAHYP